MVKNKKILIVDDDDRNIFALSTVLKSRGAICLSAKNGAEGIRVVEENPDLDFVLMDIMMPVMNGYEAIQLLKENEQLRHIPVIALTANAMKGDMEKCKAAGANEYMSKPVDVNKLLQVLNGL